MKRLGVPVIVATCLFAATSEAGRPVNATDFGDRWPFTVEAGEIACIRGPEAAGRRHDAALFRASGKTYALNGAAKQLGHLEIDPIWKADPARPQRRVSMAPLIYLALSECRSNP
jgi:hypothetical protein